MLGLASADVSTGEVQVMQREASDALHQQLAQLAPPNCSAAPLTETGLVPRPSATHTRRQHPFSRPDAEAALLRHYKLASLDGLGLPELPLALRPWGAC